MCEYCDPGKDRPDSRPEVPVVMDKGGSGAKLPSVPVRTEGNPRTG